ncbi:unnamed protein product [Symbiodinium microadriaticum]|nr:unnamed protein product [Symbiodinium microadriaticum]
MIQVSRFLVISWLAGPFGWFSQPPGVQAYKLAETPINITDSTNATVVREVERLLGKNLVHDAGEVNSLHPHEEGATNGTSGMDSLARNLEFLLLKVGQLETVVQLQQAELDAAHTEIGALKEHVGLDVEHVAMAKKRSRDPHAAGDVLKSVLDKHHRQRETRNHDPNAHKDPVTDDSEVAPAQTESPAEALLQREAQRSKKEEISHHSLDASLSSKIPFVDDIADAVESVSGSGLSVGDLESAFDRVSDVNKVQFVQNTVIDTVQKATVILQGFTGGFAFSEVSVPLPNPLDHLPEQIKKVAGASAEMVDRLISMSWELLNTAHCNRGDTFHCMAKRVATYVMQFEPPMNFLPHQLHTVVNAGQEAVDRLFQMIHALLNTAHCNRADSFHCMAKLVANHVQDFAPPLNWLPEQLHTVVNAGQEGVASNVFHCMAKKVANYVMEFAPPLNFLPQQLHTVVNAGQEGVDRIFAMIRDLLNTPGCDRADIFDCMAKRVAGDVMKFEPPLNFLPSPVGLLAGSDVNSIQSLVTMGNDLQNCQDFESGHDVMTCLGFKIMERVPPLNYLNKLGDTIGVYLETFAKAGTSLAMKALQGGTSLIQKASLSEFPPVGKMPVRHEQGNLAVQTHSQKMHPSLLQLMSAHEQGQGQGQEDVISPKFAPGEDAKVTTKSQGSESESEEKAGSWYFNTEQELEKRQPADPSSMVAWFKSEEADSSWNSSVGSWQARVTRGSPTRKVEAGHGATFPVAYLSGDAHTGIDFGVIMKPDFTICSVTRYLGGTNKRILQHNQHNWLHGHWEGAVGVAFYNNHWAYKHGWGKPQTDWLVMCGNSAGAVFRGQEMTNIGDGNVAESNGDAHLYINDGHYTESSDFGVMEVIVWNRALSDAEMLTSMEYLNSKLGPLPPHPADPSSMVAWFKSEEADSAWNSAVGSWQARVTRGSPTKKVEAGHGATSPVAYLSGDAHTGIDFGVIMKPDFTICSVTRYLGGTNKRILQHNHPNWLHGHWGGAVGVAFYGDWVYQHGWGKPQTDWLVMCGNSAGAIFRGQEKRNIGEGAEKVVKSNGDAHLYINDGHYTESSDFGVMEVIVWNRALSDGEMWTSMKYLNAKLSGPEF